MALDIHDTIAALSSPPGPAVRGIIRVSGSEVRASLSGLFEPDDSDRWKHARTAQRHQGIFRVPEIDRGIRVSVHFWPDARSYTGEPMAEVHAPGSPPLLEAMLTALYHGTVRPARAGEFTLRSFLSGKIDLVQAEAVLGVIDADDQVELQAALEQLAGGISGQITAVRDDLLKLLADLEAGLDFAEEDIEFVNSENVLRRLRGAEKEISQLIGQAVQRMRSGVTARVVLAGLPNAGKSTLFNALLGRSAALVSEVAGTTRDYLSAEAHWRGMRLELVDTAGGGSHAVGTPQSALQARDAQLERADLVLWCTASKESHESVHDQAATLGINCPVLQVATKCDLRTDQTGGCLEVSGLTGRGLDRLITEIVQRLSQADESAGRLLGTTGARCRESLTGAVAAIGRAIEIAESALGDELLAIEIRLALDELGKVCGAVYTDDILDRIFSSFCIGK